MRLISDQHFSFYLQVFKPEFDAQLEQKIVKQMQKLLPPVLFEG